MSTVLLVAATWRELEPLRDLLSRTQPLPVGWGEGQLGQVGATQVALVVTGVGKVNAAAGVATALARLEPRAVVQVGVGGAYPGHGLEPGAVAVAGEEVQLDLGVRLPERFIDLAELGFALLPGTRVPGNRLELDQLLARELAAGVAPVLRFGTSDTVTADPRELERTSRLSAVAVESMEGAAAAQVSLALGVPFAEVRGVSNMVADRDRHRWRLDEAVAASCRLVSAWLERGAPTPAETAPEVASG